ncbi:hypothetical protein jhhlp_005352 [Lomentospora prolificans]|uniref:Uncharacterized protein n=1 Tax=Lomentospora prolificans TaxID=41688 RepID=A0A2N3N7K9_9PEZI|nr:hypothetical protein jhhlp_005352 [Lomentospora prolificans]
MTSKEQEAIAGEQGVIEDEALPQYDAQLSTPPPESTLKTPGPTVDSPFRFPSGTPPPAYQEASSGHKPIAIPQSVGGAASPFIVAYPPSLLRHGITSETWCSFLNTVSAFLTANVSERALAHAADAAKQFADGPKEVAKDVISHAKGVGKGIGRNAKRGNIVGAASGVITGAVSVPISAALGIVRATLGLPGSTLSAVAKRPQTPRERAAAYLAVANRDWLKPRGLAARIMDSEELGRAVSASVAVLLECANAAGDASAAKQLESLQRYTATLEVVKNTDLKLGAQTLWLVLLYTA